MELRRTADLAEDDASTESGGAGGLVIAADA